MSVNDLPVGRSVEETLRLVKAFQFVETHGEVCPASWTPESPTVSGPPRTRRTKTGNLSVSESSFQNKITKKLVLKPKN